VNFIIDWVRAIADSTKDSPLWLELIFLLAGMLAFFAMVALMFIAIAWLVQLPEQIHYAWKTGRWRR
jgi:hypothetical protein